MFFTNNIRVRHTERTLKDDTLPIPYPHAMLSRLQTIYFGVFLKPWSGLSCNPYLYNTQSLLHPAYSRCIGVDAIRHFNKTDNTPTPHKWIQQTYNALDNLNTISDNESLITMIEKMAMNSLGLTDAAILNEHNYFTDK